MREGGNPAIQTAREADNISVLYRYTGVVQSTGFPPSRERRCFWSWDNLGLRLQYHFTKDRSESDTRNCRFTFEKAAQG